MAAMLSHADSAIDYFARRQSMRRRSLAAGHSKLHQLGHNCWQDRVVGVLTPGDDSQGMNPCIRAVVRMAMYMGAKVIYIKHGFKGMVEGGDNYVEATWAKTSGILGQGGSILKSNKCPEFLKRPARLKAVESLVRNNISYLVGIGGDGTLRAFRTLHEEWKELLTELHDREVLSKVQLARHKHFRVVVVISSVVNDIIGIDIAIGVDSARQRICEATDAISTTSNSSEQAFVIEVMGGKSGTLALTAGLACGASMIFIPEWPPEGDWQQELVNKIKADTKLGNEGILIIVSEGTTDRMGKPIKADEIRDVLISKLNMDAVVTVLGHVQRGGTPSAFDRHIASRLGAEAMMIIKDLPAAMGSCALGFIGSDLTVLDLDFCLQTTDRFRGHMKDLNFTSAVRARDYQFQSLLGCYILMHSLKPANVLCIPGLSSVHKIGILKVGVSPIGHCVVAKAIVGYSISKGFTCFGIKDGFEGLVAGKVFPLEWKDVKQWNAQSNECLGGSTTCADRVGFGNIAEALKKWGIGGLVIMGSFSAFESLHQIWEVQKKYRPLCIPMVLVPLTILNNVPGTQEAIGADSALNEIVTYCEKMTRVARGRADCVFIVETKEAKNSYLTVMCALCVGADAAYTRQAPMTLDILLADAYHIKKKIRTSQVRVGLVVRSEFANDNYNTDFVHKLFAEVGKDAFICRQAVIGAIQTGCLPSAFDRVICTQYGLSAANWLIEKIEECTTVDGDVYTLSKDSKVVLCSRRSTPSFKTISALGVESDFTDKLPTYMWWSKLRPLLRILAQHYEEDYETESLNEEEFINESERERADDLASFFTHSSSGLTSKAHSEDYVYTGAESMPSTPV